MKRLILIRHAKSDWGNDTLMDIHRPLNERGYNDAHFLSKKFVSENKQIDLIVSSPAIRAFTTASIFAKELKYSHDRILMREKLYEAHPDTIQSIITELPQSANTVIIFGHNPGFTEIFNTISDSFIDNIPTCGIMQIDFTIKDWTEVIHEKGMFVSSTFPKDFN